MHSRFYTYGSQPSGALAGGGPAPMEETGEMPQEQAAEGAPGEQQEGALGGRGDTIHAQLSNGEYVIDAETVALLGDGSAEEGARKLDEWRAEIWKQKGGAMSEGKMSPDAQEPSKYMADAGQGQ